jgi:two-component system sensor histidine kinase ArlS
MNLKLKIIFVLTAWMLVVLALSNVFIYYLFIRLTAGSEIQLLTEKAQTLIRKDLVHYPEYWRSPGPLEELLIPQEMIRYITPNSTVAYQIYSDEDLLIKPAQYSTKDTSTYIRAPKAGLYVYVLSPVYIEGKQVATLEIGRNLSDVGSYLDTLLTVLISTSAVAVLLSIMGGYLYTRIVFKPLDQLIYTMQTIEKSGVFRLIELPQPQRPPKDELARLGDTFNRMIIKLEKNFQRQRQFLADASHELRTPLTIIESYASLLRRWASNDPKLREEALGAIQAEAAHLKGLTHNLLSLIDEEKDQQYRWTTINLIPLITSTVASLRLTSGRSIEIVFSNHAEDPIMLACDPDKMKQLLIILLDNALKYSKHPVTVTVRVEHLYMQLQIIDQGIGVANSDIPYLFDRFYRTDKARNRKQGGVGLGLAIADNIVRQHEGTIELTSRLGEGTTVTVTIPKKCQ